MSQLALQLAVGVGMLMLTMFIHAAGLTGLLALIRANRGRLRLDRRWYVSAGATVVVLLGLIALHLFEIGLYAALYLALDAVDGVEAATYFSAAAYATAGVGELVLDDDWRLLGALEALNGFLLIGWSTALFVSVLLRIWAGENEWLRPGG